MSEQKPIPVADALKALRMAQGFMSPDAVQPWFATEGDATFYGFARAVLPGMVEYMIHGLSQHRPHDRLGAGVSYDAIAPIVAWARTREEWGR